MTDMTKHFLPDYHHWGCVSSRIEEKIKVPIRRVPHVAQWTGDPPFYVLGCTWYHRNSQGPLTQEKFDKDLEGAILDFTNELNQHEEFLAYPITYHPPTAYGMAYHDWIGGSYPFDVRAVITLDSAIPAGVDEDGEEVVEAGLKFHLTTLIGRK